MEIQKTNNLGIRTYKLNDPLPDLTDAKALPLDLMEDYWTPEVEGETKRVYFQGIKTVTTTNDQGEEYTGEHAIFIEQTDGTDKRIKNATVRLVSAVKDLEQGTPLEITYLGKQRTQKGHNIDTWRIVPLFFPEHQDEPDLEGIEI